MTVHKRPYEEGDKAVVYMFRGNDVVILDMDWKRVKFGREAHMCNLIDEDLELIPEFIKMCRDFINGEIDETGLFNFIVN